MPQWSDFLVQSKTPSSSWWWGKKKPPVDYVDVYKTRLEQLLKFKVGIEELTEEESQSILQDVNDQLATLPTRNYRGGRLTNLDRINRAFLSLPVLPYTEEVSVTSEKWMEKVNFYKAKLQVKQQNQQKQQKAALEIASKKRSYLPQLQDYLSGEVATSGGITQEQANQYYQAEENQIDIGVDPSKLPNYENVQNWLKAQTPLVKAQKKGEAFTKAAYGQLPPDLYQQKQAERQSSIDRIFRLEGRLPIDEMLRQDTAVSRRNQIISSAFSSDANRAELFKQFENKRAYELGRLDPEADWIQRWFKEHEENPYAPPTTTQDRLNALNQELAKWQSIGQNYPDALVDVGDTLTWGDLANQSIQNINQMLEDIKNAPPDEIKQRPPTAPETPAWLSSLVPELKTGQEIRKNVTVPTPSGQQWGQLAPSTQSRYAGYSEWAGIPIKDTLARMNLMRPETPVGAGRFKWTPPRQF